ncbi:3-deoxy-manno-octulosonate cytidylyltransferase [Temperatibacter marinus]|uniref:3-deoxy-manno-octulosonate cytidylyltransferase n=1 Tax=Temperatibacter marinus TaxID=1456591 RepID=A0AA52EHK4_9PROT|nr:3-deoxy-manno-octulosonate cytidylyltransferase [Temperatibacter marinus]WND02920.1 3-deoxy-manno-octulosonate cytidylyltransferase [Temperatibacter marinus]
MKIIIPSRYDSTRLPGKPLADIAGKPMIVHVLEQARKVAGADNVWVACDDDRIESAVIQAGGQAVKTSPSHQSGTDRIAEAAAKIGLEDDEIIINIQGDEPLIPLELVQKTYDLFSENPLAQMTTIVVPIASPKDVANPNVVKAVLDDQNRALYFSRAPIPFDRDTEVSEQGESPYLRHVGIYGYRHSSLKVLTKAPVNSLEALEKLEQLRALGLGMTIQVGIYADPIPHGVDTPEDLKTVQALMEAV